MCAKVVGYCMPGLLHFSLEEAVRPSTPHTRNQSHTLKILVTRGMQPPQPVPAFVLDFRPSMSVVPDWTHATIAPFVTFCKGISFHMRKCV